MKYLGMTKLPCRFAVTPLPRNCTVKSRKIVLPLKDLTPYKKDWKARKNSKQYLRRRIAHLNLPKESGLIPSPSL